MRRIPLLIVALVPALLPLLPERPPADSGPALIGWHLVGWNDLGMHCMDSDFSLFSILPPYNTVTAQLVDAQGRLVRATNGITVTYEAVADPEGSINTTAIGKTNFWTYSGQLYGGSPTPDRGLAGFDMPGPANVPQAMTFDASKALFHAEGIPITPYDDAGRKRPYPLMKLVARDAAQNVLATARVVLPVSDEMDCTLCHASGTVAAARPRAGWSFDPDWERDYRQNVLLLHDDKQATNPLYASSLSAAGYDARGLAATALGGRSVLCAKCHLSNALPGTGLPGVSAFTSAMHGGHAQVIDPITQLPLDASTNRAACYRCHPGSETRCLRDPMGNAVAPDGSNVMQCQNCHGRMSAVGASARAGWLDEPVCESCHTGTATRNNGLIRYTDSFDTNGLWRVAVDRTFATNLNAPVPPYSLYRFSVGHGGLRCEACHGATHAVYPSTHDNDNLLALDHQGHVGTLVECTSCHATTPAAGLGGPHGMHRVDQGWAVGHGDFVENNGAATCQPCHGTDYRGTVLSRMHADRTFQTTRYGAKVFARGAQISCWACHNGPSSDDPTRNRTPVVLDANATAGAAPVAIPLTASDPDANPLTLRVLTPPQYGRVAIQNRTATYHPDPGFAGVDAFTFVAWDGFVDSAPGRVQVTRLAGSTSYGLGYPGTNGVVPQLGTDLPPRLGATFQLQLGSTGVAAPFALLIGVEPAKLRTPLGGALLTLAPTMITGSLPAQGASVPVGLPADPSLVGLRLYLQTALVDPGARFGVAFSAGLRLTLGQ